MVRVIDGGIRLIRKDGVLKLVIASKVTLSTSHFKPLKFYKRSKKTLKFL